MGREIPEDDEDKSSESEVDGDDDVDMEDVRPRGLSPNFGGLLVGLLAGNWILGMLSSDDVTNDVCRNFTRSMLCRVMSLRTDGLLLALSEHTLHLEHISFLASNRRNRPQLPIWYRFESRSIYLNYQFKSTNQPVQLLSGKSPGAAWRPIGLVSSSQDIPRPIRGPLKSHQDLNVDFKASIDTDGTVFHQDCPQKTARIAKLVTEFSVWASEEWLKIYFDFPEVRQKYNGTISSKTVGLLLTVLAGGDLQHLVENPRVPRALAAAAGARLAAAASRCMKYHAESHRTLSLGQELTKTLSFLFGDVLQFSAKQLQNSNEALKNIPEAARAFYPKRFGRIIVQFAICALSHEPGVSKQAGFKYANNKWYHWQPRFKCSFHKLS
ncbi:hypothetical protein B0H14DRAFT_3716059 [Mycena olivaceomarginata]|nr:hypothetical protein B0H14DRAFT_3716059 [Mycena olivaceomarginata]